MMMIIVCLIYVWLSAAHLQGEFITGKVLHTGSSQLGCTALHCSLYCRVYCRVEHSWCPCWAPARPRRAGAVQ